MTTADTFAPWPEPPYIAALRAKGATLERVLDSLDDVIAYAVRHDGRAPVGQLRAILAEVAS